MQLDVIAHVIQLSVAPVFLLTGVGAILGVLSNRLVRIVDRARTLEKQTAESGGAAQAQPELLLELRTLSRRARLINLAVSLCVICALLIPAVIVGLFVSAIWVQDTTTIVAVLFTTALLALIAGLLCFLREVQLATATLRIGPRE
jgi:hypothetical protein